MQGKKSACVRYWQLGPIWLGNDNWENTFDKAILSCYLQNRWRQTYGYLRKGKQHMLYIPEEHAEAFQAWALWTEKAIK